MENIRTKNNSTIALNILCVKEKEICPVYISKSNSINDSNRRTGPISRPMPRALGHAKSLKQARFFGRANFALKKEERKKRKKKSLDLQIYSRIGKTMKKVVVNSKYYREHQHI